MMVGMSRASDRSWTTPTRNGGGSRTSVGGHSPWRASSTGLQMAAVIGHFILHGHDRDKLAVWPVIRFEPACRTNGGPRALTYRYRRITIHVPGSLGRASALDQPSGTGG